MKFVTLIALAFSQAAAIENKAALDLLNEAFANAEEGTEEHAKLSLIMNSMSGAGPTDAEILA